MHPATSQTAFLDRFEWLRRRIRRITVGTALCGAALALVAVVAVVAGIDYRYELDWTARAVALAAIAGVVFVGLGARVWSVLSRWSRPTTAAELEERFPELGQRVRTAVQYGAQDETKIQQEGATPSLVAALEADTSRRTAPLGLDAVVPTKRLVAAAAATVAAALALWGSTSSDWEWRTAVRRALLSDVPYTTLAVAPESAEVEEGSDVGVTVVLRGRTGRDVVLLSRPADQPHAAWTERTLETAGAEPAGENVLEYATSLTRVGEPLDYRVVAGPAASDVYRIAVRYPLEIKRVEADIESPAYTGLPVKTVGDGNISALKGSRGTFRIKLDRAPASAEAVVRRLGQLEDGEEREVRVPLEADGATLTMDLELDRDMIWSIAARSIDGTALPENAFRIRVREDQPPRVGFEAPDDALEVHTLAEILMRIQASDDYGLTRAGVVFQINNNDEHTLLQEDFKEVAEAARDVERSGALTPRTRSILERTLPLEHFALTQKDCVIYYAFAEDNVPRRPQRAETELRFIDIRPFKQRFRLAEPGEGMGSGAGFTSLEELIRQQRYVLNRTIRLDRRRERWGDRELSTVDRLITSQSKLADLTRELAERLVAEGADDIDVLFQAEAAMVNAVDSLSVGKYDTAVLQEKDAQQQLVEARNVLEILLRQSQNNASLRRALAMINRGLRQKLRRDRSEDEETARAVVERLQKLARDEDEISRQLAALSAMMQAGGNAGSTDGESPMPGKEPASSSGEKKVMSPRELEERQYDIVAEAQEIQRILSEIEGVTDLVRERMEAAAGQTDQAAGTLARGDTDGAARQTRRAAAMLGELARHAAALLAEEAPERVARARDTAAVIADRQRKMADRLSDDATSAGRMPADRPPGEQMQGTGANDDTPAAEAERIAERAKTLDDVLRAIAESKRIDDGEAADRVAEVIAERDVGETLKRVERLPQTLGREERPSPETVAEVRDTADRTEVVARDLDRIYRSLVVPRIEELRKLEQEAVALQERMNRLQTAEAVRQWQAAFAELLEDLEQAAGGSSAREELSEKARTGDLPAAGDWSGPGATGSFGPPRLYGTHVPLLVEELQRQIQELVLTDILADRDENTPPQYEHLVKRYLKVLAVENPRK